MWVTAAQLSRFPLHPVHNAAVRKRYRILLAVVVVAITGVIAWQGLREHEPHYQGKSASYWMNYNYRGRDADRMFREAWRGLGSNAVPFLVKALNRRESAQPEITYRSVVKGLPPRLKGIFPTPSPPAEIVRSHAASALGLIGTDSRPAIPALLCTMNEDEEEFVCRVAASGSPHLTLRSPVTGRCETGASLFQEASMQVPLPRRTITKTECSAQSCLRVEFRSVSP